MAQTWVVTGANRGIGLEFARQLHERGDRVIATCRDAEGAGELRDLGVRVEILEVTSVESCDRLRQALRGVAVDVLVNNAGVASRNATLESVTIEDMLKSFTVNSISPLLVTRALLENVRAGSRKTIVSISSQLGSIANNSGGSSYAYRASKAALNQLNRSLSVELGKDGIACVVMHPGWVQTDMGGKNATLTPRQSVSAMVATIDGFSITDSGKFFNYDGTGLPW